MDNGEGWICKTRRIEQPPFFQKKVLLFIDKLQTIYHSWYTSNSFSFFSILHLMNENQCKAYERDSGNVGFKKHIHSEDEY